MSRGDGYARGGVTLGRYLLGRTKEPEGIIKEGVKGKKSLGKRITG